MKKVIDFVIGFVKKNLKALFLGLVLFLVPFDIIGFFASAAEELPRRDLQAFFTEQRKIKSFLQGPKAALEMPRDIKAFFVEQQSQEPKKADSLNWKRILVETVAAIIAYGGLYGLYHWSRNRKASKNQPPTEDQDTLD